MALEAWALDGIQLTSGSFLMMELQAPPPKAKPEWISGADSEWAALLGEPLHENREFTMKLRIPVAANMDAALDLIAVIRDKLRLASRSRDGIPLVWTPHNSARSRMFDVLHGEITELPVGIDGQEAEWFKAHPIFTMVLTAKPYWYDASETLSSTASASAPLTTLAVTVGGDVPALSRLIVTDTATQVRRDVQWGLENRSYNAAAGLLLDSDALVTTDFAGLQATRTGAYDPVGGTNVIRGTALTGAAVPLAGTGAQSHVGTYRVWARAHLAHGFTALRLVWRGSGGTWTVNDWARPSFSYYELDRFYELDLGTITIPAVKTGTQRWEGRVEVTVPSNTAGMTSAAIDLDYLMLIPVGEGSGRSRTIYRWTPGTLTGYDQFEGMTAGAVLNGRVAPTGQTWATSARGTAPQDFTSAGSGYLYRDSATDDTLTSSFRLALFGITNYTNSEISITETIPATHPSSGSSLYAIARYVDTNNYAYASLTRFSGSYYTGYLYAGARIAGTDTRFDTAQPIAMPSLTTTLRLVVFSTGKLVGQLYDPASGVVYAQVEMLNSALATGVLSAGRVGIANTGSVNPWERRFDNFTFGAPSEEDVIINSGRTFEYRHDGEMGADLTNTYVGPHGSYRGATFTLPPGTSRIAAAARRVDVTENPVDNVTDATQIQVAYRTRGLVVPRT